MMKTIAFVHNTFPNGGSEKVTLDIAEGLSQKGFNVIVLCRDFRPLLMPENCPIKVLTYKNRLKEKASAWEIIEYVHNEGISVLTYVYFQPYFTSLIRKETGCQIVFADHSSPFWLARAKNEGRARMANAGFGKKLCWHLWYKPLIKILHYYDRREQRKCKKLLNVVDAYIVLCNAYSEEITNILYLNEPTHNKIRVIPNYQEPNDNPKLKKEHVVLYVGRLTYADKRVDRMLHIWKRVEEQAPEWRLEIVGDGEEEEKLKALAEELQLKRVSFEGRQQPQQYYNNAAILCLTSTFEGWGLVLTEAQTNGVVPIAFACSAGVETIMKPSGENGILVNPFDEDEYSIHLLSLLKDEQLRRKIQQNVLKKKYPKQKTIDLYAELYQNLTNNKNK